METGCFGLIDSQNNLIKLPSWQYPLQYLLEVGWQR